MHTNINRALNFILLLFTLVALWLGYWGVLRASELLARNDNPRLVITEQHLQRGQILDRHGTPLAWSETNAQGQSERRYAGDWLAHAVGYYSLHHGVGGIEATFDEELRGETERTAWQDWRDTLLHRPQIGQDVKLSLDANLQQAASQALGEHSGAIVLIEANSGQVLALVSQPTFAPHQLDKDWDALQKASGQPLFNRATQGLYPPGATFNLIVMAAALEEKLTTPAEIFHDKYGRQEFGQATIRCTNHPGLVSFDLLHATAFGCNVTFAQLSLRLGEKRLSNYAGWFGIGVAPELEIPTQSGQLSGDEPFTEESLAMLGFGQGETLVSPLQMALIGATIANDGSMPRATLLLDRIKAARPVITPQTAQQIRQAMTIAVTKGPAKQAALADVTVAGKVGTANTGQDIAPHAWFVGFAPAGPEDEPGFAIAIVVEHGGKREEAAAPIAAQILSLAINSP